MKKSEKVSLNLLQMLEKDNALPDYDTETVIRQTISKPSWDEHRHFVISIIRTPTDTPESNVEKPDV